MPRARPAPAGRAPEAAGRDARTPRQALIDAVSADPTLLAAFQEGWGRESVAAYLEEYRHIPDIVQRLASDLGVVLPS